MSRPLPVMFIHGFNGFPAGWEPFRRALVARGADPELLWSFHYGWLESGEADAVPVSRPSLAQRLGLRFGQREIPRPAIARTYNNMGDIRQIASRLSRREAEDPESLNSQLARLSEASVRKGGPAKVIIVAHSMGGLIARYYLAQRQPDEWGTVNEGVVERLITIGTPHLGADLLRIIRLVPPDAFIWTVLRWLEKLRLVQGNPSQELAQLEAEVEALQMRVQAEELPASAQGYLDSPALSQMAPGSEFLEALAHPDATPEDVRYDLMWGDVRFTATVRWRRLVLWSRTVTFGDLLIRMNSASTLPGAEFQQHPFVWAREFEVQVGNPAATAYNVSRFLPPVAHSNLLLNEEVHAAVASLIGL